MRIADCPPRPRPSASVRSLAPLLRYAGCAGTWYRTRASKAKKSAKRSGSPRTANSPSRRPTPCPTPSARCHCRSDTPAQKQRAARYKAPFAPSPKKANEAPDTARSGPPPKRPKATKRMAHPHRAREKNARRLEKSRTEKKPPPFHSRAHSWKAAPVFWDRGPQNRDWNERAPHRKPRPEAAP